MARKIDDGIRERILKESVKLFSEKGFHGTSMRDLAAGAGCSLPMLYYYYKNKEDLFYEVAYNEFVALIERLNQQVKRGKTLQETYVEAIKQRKELSDYDKAVYKLALKVWLGFDGDSKVRADLIVWEEGRRNRTQTIFKSMCTSSGLLPVLANVIVRVMENMIEKIILFNEDIADDTIQKEIDFVIREI